MALVLSYVRVAPDQLSVLLGLLQLLLDQVSQCASRENLLLGLAHVTLYLTVWSSVARFCPSLTRKSWTCPIRNSRYLSTLLDGCRCSTQNAGVLYAQPSPLAGRSRVSRDLANYTHRVAPSNRRKSPSTSSTRASPSPAATTGTAHSSRT
jgi:hypothetical protein